VAADQPTRWTLSELMDFESALAAWDGRAEPDREGGTRAATLQRWLRRQRLPGHGRRWVQGLDGAALLVAAAAALLGAGAVWGTLDRASAGVHVVWMLSTTLILPWLLLLGGVIVWAARGWIPGIGLVGGALMGLARRLVPEESRARVDRLRRSGELARVLAWHLAARSQWLAAAFHGGALAGLAGMVFFKSVGFFWETTTETAMREFLEKFVHAASLPWRGWLPAAVPEIEATASTAAWLQAGPGWWQFSLLALAVWGVTPRLLLGLALTWQKRRCLARLTFQDPPHRKLWRELTVVRRGAPLKAPIDGAVVITVGRADPPRELLRPFLLRRLRMNPTAWESLGVLDADREDAARQALDKAPAGIVLFAEGWSLAPRQIARALDEIAARAGERRRVLLVGNPAEGRLDPVTATERSQWEGFVDGRRDDAVELIFYEPT
jgi:hypothetical protein